MIAPAMNPSFGRWALALGVVATSVLPGLACGKAKGGLMLAVTTDMRAPKDVNVVSVSIQVGPEVKYNFIGRVTPEGEVLLPATLAIAEPDDPAQPVRIRVIAFKDRKPRVLRDAVTTIPRDGRLGLLRMPLSFVNDGSATGELPAANLPNRRVATSGLKLLADGFNPYGVDVVPACADPDQTFVDGECASAKVDSSTLPEFDPKLVFGEAPGACYDPVDCAQGWREAIVDPATCTAPKDGDVTNVTLVTEDTGACNANGRCFVPIDRGDGWREENGRVVLPRGVCKKIREGSKLGFIGGTRCGAKTSALPVCTGPSPAPVAPAPTRTKVVDADFASAFAVFPDRVYLAARDGVFVSPPGQPATRLGGPASTRSSWSIAVAGSDLSFAAATPSSTVELTGYHFLANDLQTVSMTGTQPGGRILGTAVTASGAYYAVSNGAGTGNLYYADGSATFPLLSPRDITAVAIVGPDVLVGDAVGQLQACDAATPSSCGNVLPYAPGSLPVDRIAATPSARAVLLRRDSLALASRQPNRTYTAEKLLDRALVGTTIEGEYFPPGLAANDKCVFWSDAEGVNYQVLAGGAGGRVSALSATIPYITTSGTDVHFVVRESIANGGAVFRADVPGPCL